MMPFLDNKFIRFGLFGLGAVLALAVAAFVLQLFFGMSQSTGLSSNKLGGMYMADMAMTESIVAQAPAMGRAAFSGDAAELSYYPEPMPPMPSPGGYTSGLERYETTSYNLSAQTTGREFETLCDTLSNLKAEREIHFKHLNTSLNRCDARSLS